jgi:hypothetical protein
MAKQDFGNWMSTLAKSADAATSETLDKIKEKLAAEKQAKIESALRSIFNQMEQQVQMLASVRRQEDGIKKRIKELERAANDIVTGKFEASEVNSNPSSLGELLREKLERDRRGY